MKNKFLKNIIVTINILFALTLLLCVLSPYVNPIYLNIVSFSGLIFPVIFVINLMFFIWWIIKLNKVLYISLIPLLLSFNLVSTYFNLISISEVKNTKTEIKVLSYNCMLFDLYNFSHNKESIDKYYEFLKSENADIVCLQEFFSRHEVNYFNHNDSLPVFLKTNIHSEFSKIVRDSIDFYGIATLTKYPIINKGKIDFGNKTDNSCIYTDVLINNDTVRIYNAHLQSLHIVQPETIYSYKYKPKKEKTKFEMLEFYLSRINNAFEKRAEQSILIAKHIKNCKYKIILCGDFNDTSSSFAYEQLTNNLEDSFLEKGFGFGITYNGKIPFQRIDFILHSENIKCLDFKVQNFDISDHFPVIAKFSYYLTN